MFIDAAEPLVVDALEGSDAEEPPSDAVVIGGDVSWNEQRARTMPKAAISGITKIHLPTTIRVETLVGSTETAHLRLDRAKTFRPTIMQSALRDG